MSPHTSSFALACAILCGLPLMASAAPVQEIVPADSFIAQHVGSTAQLHQQITMDPVVRRRLARHFHTSAPAVVRYIQDNLVLKKITVARSYQVYCINRSGQEYTINSRLAVGTPVFVMRSTGQPVLKLACGNPMVAALPPVVTKVSPYRSPELAAITKPVPAPIQAAAPLLPSTVPVVVAMNDVPGVVVMPTTHVESFIGQIPAIHGGGGSPLGFLAAIPILATLSHHGGGSNSPATSTGTTGTGTTGTTGTGTTGTTGTGTTGTTGTDTNGNNTLGTDTNGNNTNGNNTLGNSTGNTGVTPVPEPSTPAIFVVGGIGLLYLVSGAKRRRTKAR